MLSQLEVEVIHSLQFCVPGVRLRFAATEAAVFLAGIRKPIPRRVVNAILKIFRSIFQATFAIDPIVRLFLL
jgi:hypothetical protein